MRKLILAVIALTLLFSSPVFCEDKLPGGLDIYVKALQNRGSNFELFHSLRLEFEVDRYLPQKTPEAIKKEAEESYAFARNDLALVKGFKERFGKDWEREFDKYANVEEILQSLTEQYSKPAPKQKCRILLRTDPVKRRVLSISIDEKGLNGQYESQIRNIEDDALGAKNRTSAVFFVQGRSVTIGSTASVFDVYLNMGRLQGDALGLIAMFLRQKTDDRKYQFSQESIDKLKKESEKQTVAGRTEIQKVVGTVWYDEQKSKSLAYIVESKKNGFVVERLWIDASRGYVCPLIQYYDDKGKLREEYKASDYFLDEKSGLWFPELYSEGKIDKDSSSYQYRKFHIFPNAVKINEPISDGEFAIDVPEGTQVNDKRNKTRYVASDNGTLSLASGGLDVDNKPWLRKVGELPKQKETKKTAASFWVRVVLVSAGIILILLAGIRLLRKRNFLLILSAILLLPSGCSELIAPTGSSIQTIPEILDFGNVRAGSGLVHLEFTLRNVTDKTIRNIEFSSGCGCTVLERIDKPIPPKSEVKVPVKVSLFGRNGDFENTIRIKAEGEQTVMLPLKGKIITDIWFNAQSLRCTALPDKPATAVLDLHTVNYPDVAFDLSNLDKTITVKELERTTADGETTIRFSVAVEMGNTEQSSKVLSLIPMNPKIAPLTIPVYCYREQEITAPALQTKSINLGTVYAGESQKVLIYGDRDLIGIIKQAMFRGSPEGVLVTILHSEPEEDDLLRLSFQFPKEAENQMFDSKVQLITAGKREWVLPVSGLLRKEKTL